MKKYIGMSLVLSMMLPLTAMASGLAVTNTFSSGTPAKAAEVNQNFTDVAAAVNDNNTRITVNEGAISSINTTVANHTATIASNTSRITTNEAAIATNSADITTLKASNTIVGSVYRWNVFSTYNEAAGWFASNDTALYGGVAPSSWSDGNAIASSMSSDKEVLRTLFTRKGYGGANALVYADEWAGFSSTNGKHAVALFRIKNTTGSAITWVPAVNVTAYAGWGEVASVALNGTSIWSSATSAISATAPATSVSMNIPANRTSTVIFVSGSSAPYTVGSVNVRALLLAFSNNSLALPPGLEYVDDLDSATGGWEQ